MGRDIDWPEGSLTDSVAVPARKSPYDPCFIVIVRFLILNTGDSHLKELDLAPNSYFFIPPPPITSIPLGLLTPAVAIDFICLQLKLSGVLQAFGREEGIANLYTWEGLQEEGGAGAVGGVGESWKQVEC